MEQLEAVLQLAIARFALWGLSRSFFDKPDGGSGAGTVKIEVNSSRGEQTVARRTLDFLCVAGGWMSSQTAIWVASGFAGVIISWLTVASLYRIFSGTAKVSGPAKDSSCASCGKEMKVLHG